MIVQRLAKLRNEIETKQTLHKYQQSVVDQYNGDIEEWDGADYSHIECYLGSEYSRNVKEMDREKRLADAIFMEQQLIESFELKRQELLLKLKRAHDKFSDNLSSQAKSSMSAAELNDVFQISRAFVTSYFDCVDDSHNLLVLTSFVKI